MSIILTHPQATTAYKSKIFQNVNSIRQIHTILCKEAKNIPDDSDPNNPRKTANKFKGDMFELFCEFFLKEFETDKRVGISDVELNNFDYGVDFSGIGMNGKPAAVQCKFRSNINQALQYSGEMSNFLAQSFSPDNKFKVEDSNNLIVMSTTNKDLYYTTLQVACKIRHIGYKEINAMTKDNPMFWKKFNDSLKYSAKPQKKRKTITPDDHQIAALDEINKKLLSSSTQLSRGQILIPTGGGKTYIEIKTVESSIRSENKIHIVATPRISLTRQVQKDFHDYKSSDISYDMLCVCSDSEVKELEYYIGDEYIVDSATTDRKIIKSKIEESLKNEQAIIIFTTYHSLDNIGAAIKKLKVKADLIIGDEAHNLTYENFFKLLDEKQIPSKKWGFFTATRRVSSLRVKVKKGQGMDSEKFGDIVFQILPENLIKKGIILPPRLHIVHYGNKKKSALSLKRSSKKEFNENMAAVVEGVKRHEEVLKENGYGSPKVIVYCNSIVEAEAFADSEIFSKELPGYFIGTVTSKGILPKTIKSRDELFKKFENSEKGILFNVSVVSEGIDIPGVTGVLPLRQLDAITMIQSVGRSLRPLKDERGETDRNTIKKPYGWIILPVRGKEQEDIERFKNLVFAIRGELGFDFNIEEITRIDGCRTPVKDQPPEEPDYGNNNSFFTYNDVKKYAKEIEHEIEKIGLKEKAKDYEEFVNKVLYTEDPWSMIR